MQKILSLKNHLQNSALLIEPENLTVRVRRGSVNAYKPQLDQVPNQNHQQVFDIELFVQNYSGALSHLLAVLLPWVFEHCERYEPADIQFEADILGTDTVDLLLTIPDVVETIIIKDAVINNVEGKIIKECPAPALDPVLYRP